MRLNATSTFISHLKHVYYAVLGYNSPLKCDTKCSINASFLAFRGVFCPSAFVGQASPLDIPASTQDIPGPRDTAREDIAPQCTSMVLYLHNLRDLARVTTAPAMYVSPTTS